MPSQPNEKAAIMTIVCRPPIHGCLKESLEVGLDFVPIHIVQGIGVGLLDLKVRIARECHSTREGTLPNIDCQKLGGLLMHLFTSNERTTMGERCWNKGVACAETGAECKVEQHVVDTVSNDEIRWIMILCVNLENDEEARSQDRFDDDDAIHGCDPST
jgi:hypothetical protein